jgi:site-specific recombinase XerD
MSGSETERLLRDLATLDFLTDCQARNLSPRTLDAYRYQLAAFMAYLSGKPTATVTASDLRGYFVSLQARVGASTQHQAFRVLRTFYRWLVLEGERADNPMARLKPPKLPQDLLEPVSLPIVRQLLATCQRRTFTGERDRAVIMALLDTGCRASELMALDLADVNLATGATVIRHGKGNKARVVFLGAKSRRALLAYLKQRGPEPGALWQSRRGERLTVSGLGQMVRRRAKRGGLAAPSLHSFRRAFALAALRNGCDVVSLQRLLGHSDLSVIRRYLAQTTNDLAAAHAKAGPVDKGL